MCVTLYFTGGLHLLQNNIYFGKSFRNVTINGASNRQTIIEFKNSNLMAHFNDAVLTISNVVFEKCSQTMTLYVQKAHLELMNVTIQDSVHGVAAYDCPQIMVSNCKFINNINGHKL